MLLSFGDISIIVLYFVLSFGAGLYFQNKGHASITEYFLSARSTPWWIAGISMVATTFAADTPLAVAGLVAKSGISGNWIWWSAASGGMLTVFFFSRLWRRAEVLTDLEFTELRYGGKSAAFLRGFKSVYFGIFMNAVVIGWVNLAMLHILEVLFPDLNASLALIFIAFVTAVYVIISGLRGVALADVFQFVTAMTGTAVLAVYAVNHETVISAGGLTSALPKELFQFYPSFTEFSAKEGLKGVYTISLWSFVAFTAVQWWASWYPGAEPGGGGYIAQRIMSAKTEKDGFYASLLFVIAHYCLRPWPWILAGLAALVIYPDLADGEREKGYVFLIRDILPSPVKGLLVAAFAGAYMSTLSTQMNWGSSYILNDLYRRFIVKKRSERHYIRMAQFFSGAIVVLSLFVTFYLLDSISGAWEILLEFGAGSGFVLILRWYWWRINAVSEIVSMIVPALAVVFLRFLAPVLFSDSALLHFLSVFPNSLYGIVPLTVFSVIVTVYITEPERREILVSFFEKVKPPGPGWKNITGKIYPGMLSSFTGWISGTVLVYSVLFLTGSFLFGNYAAAFTYGTAAMLSLYGLVFSINRL